MLVFAALVFASSGVIYFYAAELPMRGSDCRDIFFAYFLRFRFIRRF